MAYGSRLKAQGSQLMPPGSWLKAHGSWPRTVWRWVPQARALAPNFSQAPQPTNDTPRDHPKPATRGEPHVIGDTLRTASKQGHTGIHSLVSMVTVETRSAASAGKNRDGSSALSRLLPEPALVVPNLLLRRPVVVALRKR